MCLLPFATVSGRSASRVLPGITYWRSKLVTREKVRGMCALVMVTQALSPRLVESENVINFYSCFFKYSVINKHGQHYKDENFGETKMTKKREFTHCKFTLAWHNHLLVEDGKIPSEAPMPFILIV